MYRWILITDLPQYRGNERYFAVNSHGEGLFWKEAGQAWRQMAGTGQTGHPRHDVTALRRLLRSYGVTGGRIIDRGGWP